MTATVARGRVAITGALSFTGRYLATHLLDSGMASSVLNLSSRLVPISSHNLTRSHLDHIDARGLCFGDPALLTRSLGDVDVLYCTYWNRFERDGDTFSDTSDRCRILFRCARDAGVRKVVFSAHTGMGKGDRFSYIAGKVRIISDACS